MSHHSLPQQSRVGLLLLFLCFLLPYTAHAFHSAVIPTATKTTGQDYYVHHQGYNRNIRAYSTRGSGLSSSAPPLPLIQSRSSLSRLSLGSKNLPINSRDFDRRSNNQNTLTTKPKKKQQLQPGARLRRFFIKVWNLVQRLLNRNGRNTFSNTTKGKGPGTSNKVSVDQEVTGNSKDAADTNILEEDEEAQHRVEGTATTNMPIGPRWAVAADTTDLSGNWRPIVSTEFKDQYDEYLKNCTQSGFFRKVVLSTLGLIEDEIRQSGQNLTMISKNPAGSWTRTLVSSGAEVNQQEYVPIQVTITDPDKDKVQVEAWWEQEGSVHRSFLRLKPRVKGGEFETLRYLENDNVLITESIFHPPKEPNRGAFKPGYVKWKFKRV